MITISAAFDPNGQPRKPDILGIGAQKAGTSWLAQMLGQHPQIWVPPFKEVQYFNQKFIPEHGRWIAWHYRNKPLEIRQRHKLRDVPMPPELDAYLDAITTGRMFHNQWYKRIFAPAPAGAKPMDFTPEYSTLPEEGVAYVADFLPRARILYLIRHPVDRAVSQLRMNLRRAKRDPQTVADWLTEIEAPELYDRGDYAAYVPRWRRHVGDRMLILPYGRIATDPVSVLEQVEAHLDIGPFPYANMSKRVFASPEGLRPPPEAVAALTARLQPQIDWLGAEFGADFLAATR